jgi:hypothetical protein
MQLHRDRGHRFEIKKLVRAEPPPGPANSIVSLPPAHRRALNTAPGSTISRSLAPPNAIAVPPNELIVPALLTVIGAVVAGVGSVNPWLVNVVARTPSPLIPMAPKITPPAALVIMPPACR